MGLKTVVKELSIHHSIICGWIKLIVIIVGIWLDWLLRVLRKEKQKPFDQ
ncbi:hypothetical protein [Bacillus wiedmannii]|nr:hypothetical protein [Bacillus wiedmannii]